MFNVNSHSSPYIIIANSILVSWIKSSTTIQFVIQMGQVRLHLWHYSTSIWWKFVSWTDSVDMMTPMEKQDCSRPKFDVCFVVVSLLIDMNLSFLIRLSSSKNMRNWFRSRRQNTEMEKKKSFASSVDKQFFHANSRVFLSCGFGYFITNSACRNQQLQHSFESIGFALRSHIQGKIFRFEF